MQERKYLCQLIAGLDNFVHTSEHWRVRAIKTLVKKLLRELYFEEDRLYWASNE